MIEELTNYIAANASPTFTVGTDLFALAVDSDRIDECVIIAAPAPGLVDGTLPDFRQIPLVAYSRAKTRFTARDNAYRVFNLLHGKIQSSKIRVGTQVSLTAIGSGPVYVCNFVCSTPNYVGLDESGRRFVFSMPIDVTVTNML